MKLQILAVLAGSVLAIGASGQEKGKSDQDKIQGTWTFVSAEKGGMDAKNDIPKEAKLVFANGTIKIQAEGKEKEASYKLDSSKKPKQIDITVKEGNGQEQLHKGIYHLDGDNLKICFAHAGVDRPTEFKTQAGSQDMLFVLKRDKQ
jgi:uncharacterized protein (TIGR03067 family)